MKQAVSNIEELIQELIKSDSKVRFDQLKSELNKEILNLLLEDSQKEDIFSKILVIKIFTPINEQVNFLKNNLPRGRNGFHQRQKMEEKISLLNGFLKDISELYRKQLISKLDVEIIKRNLQKTNGILEPLEEMEKIIEEIPLEQFKKFLLQKYSQTIEYFDSRQLQVKEAEQYKGELLSFIDKVRNKINFLSSEILKLETELATWEKKYNIDNENENYVYSIQETLNGIHFSEFHKEILEQLLIELSNSHLFLRELDTSGIQPLIPSSLDEETYNQSANKNELKNSKHPRIFISDNAFELFNSFNEEFVREKYVLADLSFIFQQMKYDNLIHEYVGDSEFRNWLYNIYQIDLDRTKQLSECTTAQKLSSYSHLKSQYISPQQSSC